jgi:succinate dehydrogenase/fumarate reductase cytochrome b subunit
MNQSYENNPNYQQSTHLNSDSEPMSVKSWVGTILLLVIPIVNIILLFIWAFGSGGNISRKNYAKASLIVAGCLIALYIIIAVVFVGAILNGISNS